jgi:uncharacterized RDD family membrane protein YckC
MTAPAARPPRRLLMLGEGSVAAASPAVARGPYVGLVTRVAAFAIDCAIINGFALAVAGAVALFGTIVSVPDEVDKAVVAVGGAVWVVWTVGYFVTFWATTGQTPGSRIMRFRVVAADGGTLLPRRALLRFGALWLAAIPLFAGFLLILVDDRRRGLQDMLARSLVVEAGAGEEEEPAPPQVTRRSRAPASRAGR